jgi:hypothetical protein
MIIKNLNTDIYLVGDIHSEFDTLFRKITHLEIGNCYLIHVGDGGEGFLPESKQMRQFKHYNDFFKKYNIQYLSIRGNHSNPEYFQGNVNLSNFELIPDYTYREFNGEKFLFVGGATSIDRYVRVPHMSWWEDEVFVLKPELVKEVDVLVTHSCPSWIGNFSKSGIASWCVKDPTLWAECVKERQDHDKLIELCKPKKHYCGHFHESHFTSNNGCDSRILDILEIVEHR